MKIGIVGSGISGLGAAWLLSSRHEVHLFEADHRLGGHAHTISIDENGIEVPADVGFLVYNELTYPNLIAFFKALGVETASSDMSLSIQSKEKNQEWAGANLNTVFGQRKNILKPRFYRMLLDILRFAREAEENLGMSRRHARTLGELLSECKYSREFTEDYLLPIGAAIWSTPQAKMLDFPAATFLTFFMNHKLLQVQDRPQWRTVKNGSIEYVKKAAASVAKIYLNTPVHAVERTDEGVLVKTTSGIAKFDRVVMATHAPITARIIKFASDHEREVLAAFRCEENRAVLHRDPSVMPKQKRCWSAWNVVGANEGKVSLSYYLNKLQPMRSTRDYFLTLNPQNSFPQTVQEFAFAHPQFDQHAIRAQRELPSLQGKGGVYFAGAWSRYGFHEDGLLSAVKVADLMGVSPPWKA